jgi:hypothetical protein
MMSEDQDGDGALDVAKPFSLLGLIGVTGEKNLAKQKVDDGALVGTLLRLTFKQDLNTGVA